MKENAVIDETLKINKLRYEIEIIHISMNRLVGLQELTANLLKNSLHDNNNSLNDKIEILKTIQDLADKYSRIVESITYEVDKLEKKMGVEKYNEKVQTFI